MLGTAPLMGSRWLALPLCGLIWICAEPGQAHAMGCHVPDRPALEFALTSVLSIEAIPAPSPVPRSLSVLSHSPCSRHVSASMFVKVPLQIAATGNLCSMPLLENERLLIVPAAAAGPLIVFSRLDRPPRPAPGVRFSW